MTSQNDLTPRLGSSSSRASASPVDQRDHPLAETFLRAAGQVAIVDLHVLDRTPDALGDPAHLLRVARVGVDEHVEQADPLDERAVVVDVHLRLDVALNVFPIVDTDVAARVVLGRFGSFGLLLLGRLDELVADLAPAVTTDHVVVDGEAELVLVLPLTPQVVEDFLGDGGLRCLVGLAGVDDELRIVHGDRGGHRVDRRERQVDHQLVARSRWSGTACRGRGR